MVLVFYLIRFLKDLENQDFMLTQKIQTYISKLY